MSNACHNATYYSHIKTTDVITKKANGDLANKQECRHNGIKVGTNPRIKIKKTRIRRNKSRRNLTELSRHY